MPEEGLQYAPRAAASSDAQGHLRFNSLPPGRYDLYVFARGFAPLLASPVEVRKSNELTELGALRLSPGAVIEGRVVDHQGRPVKGATVNAYGQEVRLSSAVETGADGRFVMADFSRGSRINLSADKQGYGMGRFDGVEAPTQEPVTIELPATPAHRIVCTVRDKKGEPVPGARVSFFTQDMKRMTSVMFLGNEALTDAAGRCEHEMTELGIVTLQARANGYLPREIDIEIPAEGNIEDLEITLQTAPAEIIGQVTGPGGEPIGDLDLTVFQKERAEKGPFPGPVESPRTDSNGRFRIKGLTEGGWCVYVDQRGYRRERRELEVHAGENRLDIRLERGAEVEGQVVDSAGQPVPGARLSLEPKEPSVHVYNLGGASDEAGHFLIPRVDPGLFALRIEAQGFLSSDSTEVPVTGSSVRGLRITLEREKDRKGTLSGRILGLDAKGLAQVKAVTAYQPPGTSISSQVNVRGEYRIEGLAPGEWTVSAYTANRRVEVKVHLPADGSEVHLDLELPPG